MKPHWDTYRLVLVDPLTRRVLTVSKSGILTLPTLAVQRWARVARQIQRQLHYRWRIPAFIADVVNRSSTGRVQPGFVVAESLSTPLGGTFTNSFQWVPLSQLEAHVLSGDERSFVQNYLETPQHSHKSKCGIQAILQWISEVVGCRFEDDFRVFEQWNAGAGALLFSVQNPGKQRYWFKAVPPSCGSEFKMTVALSARYSEFLPAVLGTHPAWHAWLMADAGRSIQNVDSLPPARIGAISRRLAELQCLTLADAPALLDEGCFDLRPESIVLRMQNARPQMEDALLHQDIQDLATVSVPLLDRILDETERLCANLAGQNIPYALLHCDLQLENILESSEGLRFCDWSNAAVGIPFLVYEQLRNQIPPGLSSIFRDGYRDTLAEALTDEQIRSAEILASPLAVASQLVMDLEASDVVHLPNFFRHVRSLIRQLDIALRAVNTAGRKSA